MKHNIVIFSLGMILQMIVSVVYAESGALFSIVKDCQLIRPYQVKVCLNAREATSCQLFSLNTSRLIISTRTPGHLYEYAGIKVESALQRPTNCTPLDNGYCLFSASDVMPAVIDIVSMGLMHTSVC